MSYVDAVKNFITFHIDNFSITKFWEKTVSGTYHVDDKMNRVTHEYLYHSGTGDLYQYEGEKVPSIEALAAKNVAVGLSLGFSNYYFGALAIKDFAFALISTANACKSIYQAYTEDSVKEGFNGASFFSTTATKAFNPALKHGMHAAKNFGMFTFMNAVSPTLLGYHFIVGGSAALYGMRNPLNFRNLFTKFENWWTADVAPMDDIRGLEGQEAIKAFGNTSYKLHQLVFPERITKIGNSKDTFEDGKTLKFEEVNKPKND